MLPPDENPKPSRDRGAAFLIIAILFGLLKFSAGVLFWYAVVGVPFDEYRLIQRGISAGGVVYECVEDVQDNDYGEPLYSYYCKYGFALPSGEIISSITPVYHERLPGNFISGEPVPASVTYLPDDPNVNKITNSGSTDLFDWFWRKILLGFLLLMFLTITGAVMIKQSLEAFSGANQPVSDD
jgi:hypothetical protein